MVLSDGKIGPVAQDMYDTLVGIQRGERPDPHNWITPVI
jgi:branched-chain amino acid aminotransferase